MGGVLSTRRHGTIDRAPLGELRRALGNARAWTPFLKDSIA